MVFTPLNMDRRQAVRVRPGDQQWQTAPQAPVKRWPLEREAPEQGQVTSLVEYLPDAEFPRHRHPQGEEILVLEGVFSDDSGDYPAGSYLRHPPGSEHTPCSRPGCLLFVKLNQFADGDEALLRLHPQHQVWVPDAQGREHCELHRFGLELTLLQHCPAGERLALEAVAGGELLVLEGTLMDSEGMVLPTHSWVRDPRLGQRGWQAASDARVLLKLGSLPRLQQSSPIG